MPEAIAQALATFLIPSTKPRNSIDGVTPSLRAELAAARRTASVARSRSTTSCGRAGDDVRAPQRRRPGPSAGGSRRGRLAYSSPSAVIQPCSAITLTTFSPASASACFSSAMRPALLQIVGDLVVPGLDRRVAGLAGDPDLLQQGASAGSCWCSGSRGIRSWRSLPGLAVGSSRNGRQGSSIRCSNGGRRVGQIDHPGVVGDVQAGIEVEDHAVDLAAGGRGEVDDGRADLLGRGQVADARGEIGPAVAGPGSAARWACRPSRGRPCCT